MAEFLSYLLTLGVVAFVYNFAIGRIVRSQSVRRR